ncbi:Multidrug export protein MepA [subsurface metagenome]
MGRAPIWRLLLRFSGPTIVSMVASASYNIVDAIFVGRLGPEALAALAIVFPLMLIFAAISMGTGVGAASLISRRLGARDQEGANRVASVSIALTVLVGALITLVCLPNLEALLRLFGASGPVLPLAKRYLSILVAFQALNSFLLIIANIIRAEGRPIFSSGGQIISAVTNIALDPILIFGLGPIPAMGVAGAATATVIGRGVGGLIFLFYFISGRTSYRFRPSYFLPKLKILVEIYRVGIASIVRMSAMSVVVALANTTAASFGVIPLAVLGVVFRSARFVFMVCMGLGQGMLPLVGYNFGAKQKERVGEIVIKAGLAAFIWGLLWWIVFMLFSPQVMSIFNTDPRFLLEGTRALRIFVLLFFAVGLQIVVGFFFQGIGRGLPALVVASARQVIFLVPGLLIFPQMFGLIGLWIAFPVADALSIMLTLFWTSVEFRRQGIRFRLRYG